MPSLSYLDNGRCVHQHDLDMRERVKILAKSWLASEADCIAFFKAMLYPPVPNEKLVRAMAKHKSLVRKAKIKAPTELTDEPSDNCQQIS